MASPTARRQSIAIDLVSDESSDDEVVEQPPGPVRTPAAPPQQQATLGANDFAIDDFIDFDGGLPGAFPVESAPPIGPSSPLADDQLDGEFLMIDGEQVFIPNRYVLRNLQIPMVLSRIMVLMQFANPSTLTAHRPKSGPSALRINDRMLARIHQLPLLASHSQSTTVSLTF